MYGYNILDLSTTSKYYQLTTPQSSNYLCTENVYMCTGLIKLNEVNNFQFTAIKPSITKKYTIEFWTNISSITTLTSGFHVIWKGLAAITLIQDSTNTSQLAMICWPQEFLLTGGTAIDTVFGSSLNSIYNTASILNKERKLKTTNNTNTWLFVRCASDTEFKLYYSTIEDDSQATITENSMQTTSPQSPTFSGADTTNLFVNGISTNTGSTIYIRNIWLYSNYLLPSNLTKFL